MCTIFKVIVFVVLSILTEDVLAVSKLLADPGHIGTLLLDGKHVPCMLENSGALVCGERIFYSEHLEPPGSRKFWIDVAVSIGLVLGAAIAAGLTMGLMSLDLLNLEILEKSGTPSEQKHARRILPLVRHHHLLLVSLLLVNACCNEALPLYLDEIMHPLTNIVVSVTALLLFGEIIPQALCTRYGLAIGSYAAPVVWLIIWGTWIVSYPIAKLLDCCLGHESHAYYRRAQLKELVDLHGHAEGDSEEPLSPDECLIIRGALDLKNKTVADALTPIDQVAMVSLDGILDAETMEKLATHGHSRIPVYLGTRDSNADTQLYQIVGMILSKSLIMVNPENGVPVRDCPLQSLPVVPMTKPLYDMLNMFQEGRSHMAVVVDPRDHVTYKGIITMEDVFEQLIQEPISDEKDVAIGSIRISYQPPRSGDMSGSQGGTKVSSMHVGRGASNRLRFVGRQASKESLPLLDNVSADSPSL